MSDIKIELNSAGVRELLKSSEMQSLISSHAKAIAGRSGGEIEEYVAGTRAVAIVRGDNGNNSLLKAVR